MAKIRNTPKQFTCKSCTKECSWKYSSTNTFCSNKCQADFKWNNETKPRIERGDTTEHSVNILKRYLRETRGDVCEICTQEAKWNDKPLVLQLDHIDGNSDNNQIGNIRLVCPNCHTQTDTFGSKGEGSRYRKITKRSTYIREYRGRLAQG